MSPRLASRLLAGSLLAFALAPQALAQPPRTLRFEVVSVKGQQTATWSSTVEGVNGCGTISLGGMQTIAFESLRPGRLSLQRIIRFDPRTGTRRGFTYVGANLVDTNWTFSRSFHASWPPSCDETATERYASLTSGCGTQGPFEVPVTLGWRGGAVEFRGILSSGLPRSPNYESCEYEALHEASLIDSKGRLSQRRLTSRKRATIRVKLSASEKDSLEGNGSQTTTLAAVVTLRRVR